MKNITRKIVKKNCPKCGTRLIDKGLRNKKLITLSGQITIRRTYCRCPECNKSFYPNDEVLNISHSMCSKGFAKICSQFLIFMPYEHAAKLLKEIYGHNVSETFLKDLSNKIGSRLYKESEKKARMPYNLDKSSDPIKTIYIHADGSMVPILGKESIEYRENKLGLVYTDMDIVKNISKSGKVKVKIKNKRYISSIGDGVETFKKMMKACTLEKGYSKAKQAIFLTDGAIWLKKMKNEFFPEALHILDWYHAVDHLWGTAKKIFGENNLDDCEKWVLPRKELLWDGKIDELLKQLLKEAMSSKKHQTEIFELRGYYESNKDAMHYARYRADGFFIGSGAIESANKYIVSDRLKRTGMRWTLQHANAIIWLRCKYFEDNWDSFWDEMFFPDYINHNIIIHEKVA